jgi:hypothetical protein
MGALACPSFFVLQTKTQSTAQNNAAAYAAAETYANPDM